MTDASHADLLIRLGLDARGIEAELSSRLTAAERTAVASGNRMSSAVAGGAEKVTAAQLRLVAQTERANKVLRDETASVGQLASAQAGLISAQDRYAASVARTTRAQVESTAAARSAAESSTLTGAKHLAGLALFFGGAAVLHDGVQVLKEYQANLAQTGAALKSTGGVANVSSEDVQRLGESIQGYSGQAREAIVHSENMLLTFTNVRNETGKGNDVFTRATKALADLAARGFGTVEGNARALGRALQDPISGLTLLRRSGITFTTEQQAVVKGLANSNHLLDAQKFILDVINQKVGGSAKAYGETLPGKIDITKHSLEDVERQVIGMTEPLAKAAAAVSSFIGSKEIPRDIATSFVGVTAGLVVANKAIKLFSEIRANVLRQSAANVVANEAEAASLDTLAAANTRVVEAEAGRLGLGARLSGGFAGRGKQLGAGALILGGGLALAGHGGTSTADRAKSVAGDALLGAGIGSFFPGPGTAIGAGAGALFGLSTAVFGHNDPTGQLTVRSVSAVKGDLRDVRTEIDRIKAQGAAGVENPGAPNPLLQVGLLESRQRDLAAELSKAKLEAGKTYPVFDSVTGATIRLTAAQIKAKGAADAHAKALAKQRAELQQDISLFAKDPFSGNPVAPNVKSAKETLRQAQQELAAANRAVGEARSGGSSSSGSTGSAADIRAAELRLQAARQRLATVGLRGGPGAGASAQASVISAQERLNKLRGQGVKTAGSQLGTENRITSAIQRQQDAEKAVNRARKAAQDAHGLSAAEALHRLEATVGSQRQKLKDVQTLVAQGATQGTIAELQALDSQAPGTIHQIATKGGKAYIEQFNVGIQRNAHLAKALGEALKGTETFMQKKGIRDGKAYMKGLSSIITPSFINGPAAPFEGLGQPGNPASRAVVSGTMNRLRRGNADINGYG